MKDTRKNYPLRLSQREMRELKKEARADGRTLHNYLVQIIRARQPQQRAA